MKLVHIFAAFLAVLCLLLATPVRSEEISEDELAPELPESLDFEGLLDEEDREERASCLGNGRCQSTSSYCAGSFRAGHCAGPSTVQCCVPASTTGASCLGNGRCQSTSSYCAGSFRSGHCAGPSTVQCCVPTPSSTSGSTTGGGSGGDGWLSQVSWGSRSFPVEKLDRSTRRGRTAHAAPVNKFLLHTIEGRWPQSGDWEVGTRVLDGNRYWPHFIVAKDNSGRVRVGQYLRLDQTGYALRAGNNLGCIQVEIGAKADRPFTSNDPDITAAVKALFKTLQRYTDIPNAAPVRFVGNSGYGTGAAQRLSSSAFRSVAGLVGHQHVYSNSHWDPGMIDPSVLTSP